MSLLEHPPRNLFFTGKGGVGKTSIAAATAVSLADQGHRVLLVSTDPASNLDDVFGENFGSHPGVVTSVPNLWVMNIDPEQAAAAYRERMVGPYRNLLPASAIQSMEEQFSGSCTVEIAAFDEFAKLLGAPSYQDEYDHVVFDTAPTGHTLRLLTLPSAWTEFIDSNTSGTSCLGPLAGLQAQQELYEQTVKSLCSPSLTVLALVTRPERSALNEVDRTSRELRDLGVNNQQLIVNGFFHALDNNDPVAVAMQTRCEEAIDSLPKSISNLPRTTIPLFSHSLIGVETLRRIDLASHPIQDELDKERSNEDSGNAAATSSFDGASEIRSLHELVNQLAAQKHGVVMTMGKGGVGKTTIAAAIAVALAEQGLQVHLSTTDPAAHLAATMAADEVEGLTVGRIDPAVETQKYRESVLRSAGADLDKQGQALLEEDLRSPCTEEIAVFRAFADVVSRGEDQIVVLDTAPTGHTVLLLDAAQSFHKEVTRQASEMPESVRRLLPRLRDPNFTHVVVVTLAESTPVQEAARLQYDLRRAEIEPFAWVINQSLSPLEVHDRVLQGRRENERPFIEQVHQGHARQTILVPWQTVPPTGVAGLRQLAAELS